MKPYDCLKLKTISGHLRCPKKFENTLKIHSKVSYFLCILSSSRPRKRNPAQHSVHHGAALQSKGFISIYKCLSVQNTKQDHRYN